MAPVKDRMSTSSRFGCAKATFSNMRLPRPFIKLPLTFDHKRLAEEISQFGEDEWRAHVSGFEGNSSLVLVSTNGEENDAFTGPMKASPRLDNTPYIRQIMARFNSVIGRSRLMRLAPGASVTQHTDAHYFWRNHLRIHVPIVTTPDVAFYCDTEEVHMAAGESWTFNNWLEHSVENRSGQARIHLVIDTVGSADLWKMIDGRDHQPELVEYDPTTDPELRFEGFPGLPVLSPVELRTDLLELVHDVADSASNDPEQVNALKVLTADFIHDWHSQWMVHGTTLGGFAGFKTLRDNFRRELTEKCSALALGSNSQSFLEAATYTLDAALVPENLAQPQPGAAAESTPTGKVRFDRPVFIVAAPRSGSTLLFETLAVNRELWSVGDESHKHFESISSLRPTQDNPSNRLAAEQATPEVIQTLKNAFIADLVNCDGKQMSQFSAVSRPTEVRFLEKTPKNALRIPFILEAFPDARFIFLFRDARQNISSLLDSWRSRRYVTYPHLPGWPVDNPWSHLLIPGWEKLTSNSLAEITAAQWAITNRTILEDLKSLPRERWCTIDYNALLANTHGELQRLCVFSEIIFGPRMHEIASRPLRPSKYTLTQPSPDKWKKNAAELEPVIAGTEELMGELRALL